MAAELIAAATVPMGDSSSRQPDFHLLAKEN
jgi:hypothetical protein